MRGSCAEDAAEVGVFRRRVQVVEVGVVEDVEELNVELEPDATFRREREVFEGSNISADEGAAVEGVGWRSALVRRQLGWRE